jgi:RNA polymerase sigma-70 factor (ECF subfamily)
MVVKATAVAAEVRPLDPDARLVAAARAEPQAFLALYDRYFERVLGYVRLRIRDAASCEDVTSQVFTTALAQLGRFRGEGSFAGWLFQIARNAVYDAQRRPRFERLSDDLPTVGPEIDERLLAQERRERLRRLLASLEPEQQHLLALRYGAELSFEEIGAVFGVPPGTVRVRLHRLLNQLRERYPHDA